MRCNHTSDETAPKCLLCRYIKEHKKEEKIFHVFTCYEPVRVPQKILRFFMEPEKYLCQFHEKVLIRVMEFAAAVTAIGFFIFMGWLAINNFVGNF
ncbi:hypothetical protein L3Y34_013626 [Caenorhabditis briggsae]|uniref:Uncharacterized protein n=1 Tax=Caenorhabditis briggsae TaxID=6238 RepID=A0AAE8ZYX5_CAEBR|nr:hypothetical protein L3Y34_013626 [Caenorhabditis briggsae]